MADDKKFNIKIGTEADTSGSKAAEKSIEDISDAISKLDDQITRGSQELINFGLRGEGDSPAAAALQKQLDDLNKQREAAVGTGASEAATALRDYGLEAERAEEIVRDLTDAELEQAKAAADVAREVGRTGVEHAKTAKAADEHATKLDKIEKSSSKLVAAELARAIQEVGGSFKGISPEIDIAIKTVDNFIGVLASTGDPVKATLAITVGAFGDMVKALVEFDAEVARIKQGSVDALEAIRKGREKLAFQIASENLAGLFDKETQALDRQIAALERKVQVDNARREAEAAAAAAGRSIAGNAAAVDGQAVNPQAKAAEETLAAVGQKLALLDAEMLKQEKLLELAKERESLAKSELSGFMGQEGPGGENTLRAEKQATAASDAVEDAEAALEDFRQITGFQRDKIISEATKAFDDIGAQLPGVLAGEASATITELERVAKEQGGQLSSTARAALESLRAVMADGVIKPQEIQAVQQAVQQVNASNEAYGNEVLSGFQKIVADNLATRTKLAEILKRLDEERATQ